MALRSFSTALKNSLINNDEFNYAHLVKFEKPTINEDKGKTSREPHTYTYITDGAFDIVYDDGSVSARNVPNGPQTYIANKIRNVGSVTETIEAKASNMSLTLDTSSLGTSVTSLGVNFTVGAAGSITVNSNIDLIKEGFKEGDKIKFTVLNGSGSNNAKTVIIKNFTAANVFTYTAVDTITANNDSAVTYKVDLISEELTGIISDKLATTYQTYLNREVFIYKAHFDPITNAMIGEPYLLFKGIISGGSISEDPEKESKITWTLTSHWGDFSRVSGRLTVDEQHRALDGSGIPDRDALVRPEYAGDLGFMHANQAVNVMALYNATETTYKQVDINGWWFGGKRLREVESTVQRRVDLGFNLTPKYLPVVYGVRKTDAIPIFVDTDNTDPTKVYVAYAICEGQVAGLLDFYVDGTGSVCVDEADFDLRSSNTEADLTCKGRMDKGDALQGIGIENLTTETDDDGNLQEDIVDLSGNGQSSDSNETGVIESNVPIPRFISDTGIGDPGILHEQYHKLTSPLLATYIFHAGKGDQDANPLLVSKAAQNQFKIQNSYYTDTKEYWGPSHRLLDTAYVVAEYTIADGETSIPELDFIVRGRGIKCFNYDSSYARDTFRTSATLARQFNLGDIVTLKKESDNSTIATGVEIIDKWSFLDIDGAEEFRFRLSYATAITENFYMTLTKGGQAFEYNFSISTSEADVTNDITVSQLSAASSGFTVAQHTETVGSSAVNSGLSITLSNTVATATLEAALTNTNVRTLAFSGRDDLLRRTIRGWEYNDTTNKLTKIGSGTISTLDNGVTGLVLKETIVLENEESTSNDEYNGYGITLTRFDANGVPHIQRRRIVDYIGSVGGQAARIAIVDVPWESDYLPTTGDRYVLTKGREDIRVSLNPAMQLLDYLTNERYGRGLDLDNDINLETFKEAARQCDTRSDVTVVFPASTGVAVDDVYRRSSATPTTASNFNSFFKGTVSSVVPRTVGGVNYDEVTFTNVIGKLGTKFATWLAKTQEGDDNEDLVGVGTLLWNDGKVYEMTTDVAAGSTYSNNTKFPTHDSGTTQNGLTHKTTVPLTKVAADGTDDGTVNINISFLSANGNPLVKSFVGIDFSGSGYSLYDADDVKYWKYIGWDSNHQRNVTRHQMNQVIATSNPVFDNINLMLNQFNGILRYSNGKYELGIRTKSGGDGTFVDPEIINESDIIGSISLKDGGVKKSYNSVNTSIVDPQTKFETRSVSFFNSDYLKEDRNIPKQGQYGLPGITNYYNARYNINQRLDESRFGLTISFKMMPKGGLLLPGNLIRVNYPRFGYENKEFRITNVTTNSDCLINITADEHNDSAFTVKNLAKPRFGREIETGSLQNKATVNSPTGVGGSATTSSITVTWTNGTGFNAETDKTQIWVKTTGSGAITNDSLSPTPNTNIVSLLATVENGATTFVESVDPDTSVTRSYWLRHVREVRRDWSNSSVPVKIFSAFHATGDSGGYSDTSDALFRPRKVDGLIFYARTSGESTSVTSAPTLPGTKFYNFGLKGIVSTANSTSLLNAPSASVSATGFGQWMNELLFDDNNSPGLSLQPVDTTNAQVWASRYTGEETTDVGTGSISITLSTPFLLSNTVAKVNTGDIGTTVQAFDQQLSDVAGLATTDGGFIVGDGSNFVLETESTARASLGLGTAAESESTDFVAVSGDTMTGTLTLSGAPTDTLHATTKTYVDNADASKLNLSGGTLTGALAGTTATFTAGAANNDDNANILTLNASQHARLLVDTSSTSGHRATLALESNGNELTLSTTGSASYLTSVGDLGITGGNVGIGTDTPAQLLEVNGNAAKSRFTRTGSAGPVVEFYAGGNQSGSIQVNSLGLGLGGGARENDLFLMSGGNVGIGTAADYGDKFNVNGTGHFTGNVTLSRQSNDPGSTGLVLEKTRSTSVNGNTVVQAGDQLGYVAFRGNDGDQFLDGAFVISFVDGTPGDNDMPTNLQFWTAGDGASTATERMRIDSSGRVGIGATSPNEKVHIKGSGDESVKLKLEPGTTAGNVGALILGRTDGSGSRIVTDAVTGGVPISGIAGILLGSSTNAIPAVGIQTPNTSSGHIVFNPKGSEKVRITATGDVGINTTDPIDLFHVNGISAATSLKATSGSNTNQVKITSGSSENIIYSMANDSGGARDLSFQLGLSGEVLRLAYNLITAQDRILIDNTGVGDVATTPNIFSTGTISDSTSYNYHMRFTDADGTYRGQITNNKYGTQYTTSSDYRLKTDIQDMASATARLLALKPRNFKWVAGDVRSDGFIAHEVSEVVPEAVVGEKDATEMQSIDQSKLIPLLVKTIQELEARIAVLEG